MANNRYQGTGRRKTSVARVTLVPGSGKFTINKKDISEYFNFDTLRVIAKEALELTNNTESYDVTVNVKGGGYTGQAGAIRHGVARALLEVDPDYRAELKRAGFLTRDPRKKERKKYGLKKLVNLHNSVRDRKQLYINGKALLVHTIKCFFYAFLSKFTPKFTPSLLISLWNTSSPGEIHLHRFLSVGFLFA